MRQNPDCSHTSMVYTQFGHRGWPRCGGQPRVGLMLGCMLPQAVLISPPSRDEPLAGNKHALGVPCPDLVKITRAPCMFTAPPAHSPFFSIGSPLPVRPSRPLPPPSPP